MVPTASSSPQMQGTVGCSVAIVGRSYWPRTLISTSADGEFIAPRGVRGALSVPRIHMGADALTKLEFSARVAKRAQYEAFEFEIQETDILVRNCSHEIPADHEYLVTVQQGIPIACECPADEHAETACKHRVAVAIREPVLSAVTERPSVVADGGTKPTPGQPTDRADSSAVTEDEDGPGDCDCSELDSEFPCWECVRTGRRELPE